jgi:hypothetical protein
VRSPDFFKKSLSTLPDLFWNVQNRVRTFFEYSLGERNLLTKGRHIIHHSTISQLSNPIYFVISRIYFTELLPGKTLFDALKNMS